MSVLSNDIRIEKNALRDRSKAFRASLSPKEKKRLDSKIANRLLNLWHFRDTSLILTYVSNPIEVDTHRIINQCFAQKKTVAVPRCVAGTRDMDFFVIRGFDDLERGSYGLLEPIPFRCEKLLSADESLCIVPALLFDESGYRLGFGKGYYDRFLAQFPSKTIGICYDACVEERLPHGKYDRRVHAVVTESRMIDTHSTQAQGGK